MSAFLDAVQTRLEAATPGRLTADVHPSDVAALLAVVRALIEARGDLDHHHSHMVPGRWDKDGSPCEVCARVGRLDAALNRLEEES